ncbi:MAG: hypothetical protein GOV00_00005, partial [Candidatus Altiarchaeota archaeon]|nr:hypothetical protein [Candidatus Altiarchaeota archaeon]
MTEKTTEELVRGAYLDIRPSYYSGRGAIRDDLNEKHLSKIYKDLCEIDPGRGTQMVEMVMEMPILSATDFLINFYTLEANDWRWEEHLLGNQKGVYVENAESAHNTFVSALYFGGRDQTIEIKREFLKTLPKKIGRQYRNSLNYDFEK